MKAESTAAGDRNCQPGLCLFERRKRHGLGGGNAEDADADGHCEGKKFVHSFLLCFVTYILRPRRTRMQHSHRAHEILTREIHGRRKLSQICWPVKNARKFRDSFSERLYRLGQQRVTVMSRVPPLSDGTVTVSLLYWQVCTRGGSTT
jgi:hypothetical protein